MLGIPYCSALVTSSAAVGGRLQLDVLLRFVFARQGRRRQWAPQLSRQCSTSDVQTFMAGSDTGCVFSHHEAICLARPHGRVSACAGNKRTFSFLGRVWRCVLGQTTSLYAAAVCDVHDWPAWSDSHSEYDVRYWRAETDVFHLIAASSDAAARRRPGIIYITVCGCK